MNPCVARDLWMRPESVWRNSGCFFLESAAPATGKSLAKKRGQLSHRRGQMHERGDSGGLGPVSVTQTTRLDEDGGRALAFIAGNADGYTRAVMLAHGISLALRR